MPNNPTAVEAMREALEPCPFCGADTAAYVTGDCEYTVCDTCLAEGPPAETQEEAALLWNRRAPLPAPAPMLDCEAVARELLATACGPDGPVGKAIREGADVGVISLDRSLRAIEAALALGVERAGWRDDMENAPRDGTAILIHTPRHDRKPVREAGWAQDYEGGPGYWMTPIGANGRGYTILPAAATHWMPLPAAPQPPHVEKGEG